MPRSSVGSFPTSLLVRPSATRRRPANAHDKVHVIRWWSKSHARSEWFADDGYHLDAEGRAVYVRFVDQQVDEVVAALRAPTAR